MDSTPKKSISEERLTAASSESGDLSLGALQESESLATVASSSSTLTDNVKTPRPRRVISLTNELSLDEPASKKARQADAHETVPEQDSDLSQTSNAHPSSSEATRNQLTFKRGTDSDGSDDGQYAAGIGKLLNGRYEIYKKLGVGGYAAVWLAHDKKLKRYVAVKIVKSEQIYSVSAEREIKILKVVENHRINNSRSNSVAEFLDQFTIPGEDGSQHIVMVFELLGPNLDTVIQKGMNFHIDNIRKICQQVLQGLAFLHDTCGIIHCDIKPENIMLVLEDEDIEKIASLPSENAGKLSGKWESYNIDLSDPNANVVVKIGDFGLSRLNREGAERTPTTCHYRAPEEFLLANFNVAMDMWSFGCFVYELVARRALFLCTPSNRVQHVGQHLSMIIARIGDIPLIDYLTDSNEEHLSNFFNGDGEFEPPVSRAGILSMRETGLRCSLSEQDAGLFENFIHGFLKYDLDERWTAQNGLSHQFVQLTARLPSDPDQGYLVTSLPEDKPTL